MTNEQVKSQLISIIKRIDNNVITAWSADLKKDTAAVTLEHFFGELDKTEPSIYYNGWYDDLLKLADEI